MVGPIQYQPKRMAVVLAAFLCVGLGGCGSHEDEMQRRINKSKQIVQKEKSQDMQSAAAHPQGSGSTYLRIDDGFLSVLSRTTPASLSVPVIATAIAFDHPKTINIAVYWVGTTPLPDSVEFTADGQGRQVIVPIAADDRQDAEKRAQNCVTLQATFAWNKGGPEMKALGDPKAGAVMKVRLMRGGTPQGEGAIIRWWVP